ncbi:hypothetical protein TBLA_0B07970 [Henningerozyma blattae CBS 6284]|uniref:Cdc23 domain-containing protein n=1 Tax=Henningerozyma blattae (strain ATCC 34711 / CBS 6284 / DSM 70876 / NBRC 10599 / NRRL Y-10934 / UCD 77-7) TaxID=1071380 RepID=I2GZR1_HENB6|nr:hypothetical protein TBLA_0B07970 [Tetrapisispora blattae CBS 6284]CCH59613.1 hypothetical protein TBLA_0B07970 [Tetrapisispora blattae CBS 6284]
MGTIEEAQTIEEIRQNLRKSAAELSQMKLYNSAKWSAEALVGMCESISYPDIESSGSGIPAYDSPLRGRVQGHNNNHSNYSNNHTNTSNNSTKNNMNRMMNSKINGNNTSNNANENNMKFDTLSKSNTFGFTTSENDLYLLASSLFDLKEFDRAAFFLKNATNPCLVFLRLYSMYLSWDKKVQESAESLLLTGKRPNKSNEQTEEEVGNIMLGSFYGFKSDNKTTNKDSMTVSIGNGQDLSVGLILKEVNQYIAEYETKVEEQHKGIGFALIYYLKGILQKAENNKKHAVSSILKSLSYYSFNWTCWVELTDCLERPDESVQLLRYLKEKFYFNCLEHSPTQQHPSLNIMIKFFKLNLLQEFSNNFVDEFGEELDLLFSTFPKFAFLKAQTAIINHNYMVYKTSCSLFEEVIKMDPYRLDDLDVYSHILFVMEKQPELSYLAQFASQIDRFRPETCCIIANFYSTRQEHEKSIMYFRRALTLNKKNTSAWTLMGHEFVELKNSHAAIECYRRAVDINPRDFKAWYGLGQAYEVLDMHLYSLYYFQKACALKPLDKRMWQALGECYFIVDNTDSALKCYKRALQLSDLALQDSIILYKLAILYEKMDDIENCKKMMIQTLDVEELTDGAVTDETAKARIWLTRYEQSCHNYKAAYNYAIKVTHGTSQEIEEARGIARECQKKLNKLGI